ATVSPDCTIAVSDLSFGQYDPLGEHSVRELDGSADMTMLCTRSARATIMLDWGRTPVGADRGMAFGLRRVVYQLYRDSSRTQVWGSGAEGLQFLSLGVQSPQQFSVYARIPPGQEVASGTYTDVVMATVDF
ncbi:MAG: hypothetical protein QOE68_4222, partial [Thermoanaerobaculia bacterium]|nr:hypothetical protein [Thermoanaerobaculia bacterium]